jgi:hypothetical protein
MVNRVVLTLEQPEYNALLQAALKELRNPSDQARFILRQDLQRRGLLAAQDAQKSQSGPAPQGVQDAR